MNKEHLKCLADDTDWDVLQEDDEHQRIRFVRDGVMIDIWYSKMTVGVYPPRKSLRTPKYYRRVSERQLDELLNNPSHEKNVDTA
jgi:hypothetical protein